MDANNLNFYKKKVCALELEVSRLNDELERLRELLRQVGVKQV